ncbi:hypothetical protein [Sphingomonas astaxanthinifaciens]|uniref:Uncharacterized protein n=1 Tax=Sphingomonas astaxanthinifaciens DSM 22298 TaxID=1123267 RepID=A0ABQ5Z5U1_9SPHN|nr:hypothetical protein [Sphingomonas astaxanthinifaciens]GLR46901.1 hypothetical protein GCM10007925_06120 [Sphingomonas astaxanthinifaciens DSM 22298]
MSNVEYYEEQAARCRKDAEAAPLANVRERLLQSAITWEAMAARMTRTLAQRDVNEAAKAAREG